MDTKCCSKCKKEFPNTTDYFYLDSAKVKMGHTIVLTSKCKDCKNAQNRITSRAYRQRIISEYGSTYALKKKQNPNFSKLCQERNKKYQKQVNERSKKYRAEKRPWVTKACKRNNKVHVDNITDYYVARNMSRHLNLMPSDFLKYPALIEAGRQNLKLKRKCRQSKI